MKKYRTRNGDEFIENSRVFFFFYFFRVAKHYCLTFGGVESGEPTIGQFSILIMVSREPYI